MLYGMKRYKCRMRFSLAAPTEYEIRLDFTSSHLGGVVSDHLLDTVTESRAGFS